MKHDQVVASTLSGLSSGQRMSVWAGVPVAGVYLLPEAPDGHRFDPVRESFRRYLGARPGRTLVRGNDRTAPRASFWKVNS